MLAATSRAGVTDPRGGVGGADARQDANPDVGFGVPARPPRRRFGGVGAIRLSRVYDPKRRAVGQTYLVERLWPRGVRRSDLEVTGWLKEVAPSTELRHWFAHDPAKWQEFRRRYVAELDAHPSAWQPLADAALAGELTLLYSSRDREHNNAVVLRDYLCAHLARDTHRAAKKKG